MASSIHNLAGYVPYREIKLCGNVFENVNVLFDLGGHQPLIVGRDSENSHPQVWLNVQAGSGVWVPLVTKNVPLKSQQLSAGGASVMVIQDAVEPITVVMVGSNIIVNAIQAPTGDAVDIPNIDLRPFGLNIFGDAASGLNFAGGRFIGSRMKQIGTAFKVS